MNYPLISEYIEAIKSAEDNFGELSYLRPILGEDGLPVMTGGNFAVVFKMKNEQTGKLHAVKCFLKEQEGRAEAYRMIAEELEYVSSTFLTPIKYLDKELFVDSKNSDESEFPVLLMDWVEGMTLDKYVREHIDDQYELSLLAYQFSRLAMWLMPQPFAHGDLKPDNILVKDDGTLVLVDYDGMYVPAMKGQKARELGSPDFRHPLRNEDDFDEHIDDFPLSSILLSLLAIANEPALLEKYGGDGRLLLSERDYRNIAESEGLDALRPLMADKNLTTYLSLFYLCSAQKSLFKESYHLFTLPEPAKPSFMLEEENLSTEVTDEDLANAWVDEYGVKYSADKKRLLLIPDNIIDYKTRKGATVICDYAFGNPNAGGRIKNNLKYLFISADVKIISSGTLFGSQHLSQILVDENNSVFDSRNNCNAIIRTKNNELLLGCQTTIIPNNVLSIAHTAFLSCVGLKMIHIPDSVISIGEEAFMNCSNLSQIHLPSSVKEIGSRAFNGCAIEKVTIDKENCIYDTRNFCNAIISSLDNCIVFGCKTTTIPETVACIGNKAFECCELKDIYFPNSVKTIEPSAFVFCTELQSIYFSSGLNYIGHWAFGGCKSLTSIIFEDVVKYIDSEAFFGCDAIKKIVVPIGTKGKFEKLLPQYYKDKIVEHDKEETLSAEVTEEDLSNAWIDEYGVKYNADRRKLLQAPKDIVEYSILNGTLIICDNAFSWNDNLKKVTIPDSVITIGNYSFSMCRNLSKINIPHSIKNIEEKAFWWTNLKQVTIPNSVIEIGDEAFSYCLSLIEIILPSSVIKIGRNTFYESTNLERIIIPSGLLDRYVSMLPNNKYHLRENREL